MDDVEAIPTEKVRRLAELGERQGNDDIGQEIIRFNGPEDPADPLNWSSRYKWSVVILVSMMSLVVNLAILMCAPATPRILSEFHSTDQLDSTILVSIWELGEVVGPLLIGPLSEIYGRSAVYHAANTAFIAFALIAAESQNMNMLIAFRFMLGMAVASTTLNPCIVGDMFRPEQRGRAIAVMGMTPFIAPILGPIVGGVISHSLGWRWTFWLTAIITGAFAIGFMLLYRETYKPTILARKARLLQRQNGNERLRTEYAKPSSPAILLRQSLFRPIQFLFLSVPVLLVSICCSFASSYVYIIITTLTRVFEDTYHFSESVVGLTYLGLGLGMISSVLLSGAFLDIHLKRQPHPEPEHRLPPMALGSLLVPLGLILFGWTAQEKVHYIVPVGSTALVGFGFVAVFLAAQSYVVDAFGVYAASAMAATVVLRNVASAAVPLAGPPLFGKMGLGWGMSVFGLVGLGAAPVVCVLMRCGKGMREGGWWFKASR